MSKPRVIVFIDWYSPGFKAGGPVRSMVNMVDHLRERIDLHIVTTDTDYTETTPYPGIVSDAWTTLPGGEKVWYASRKGRNTTIWKHLLGEGRWDTVYINGLFSLWFSVLPLWLLRGSRQRRVVAVRGMLAAGMMRHGALKKRLFLAVMKRLGCYKKVEFQATNPSEVGDVKRWISANAVVHEVPNLARRSATTAAPARLKRPGSLKLVSVARIAVEKNTLFAIERLAQAKGEVTLELYGPVYDEAYWARCRQAIATLPSNIRVVYKGVIDPAAVPALFQEQHALYMPSQGENFGHTMAEALVCGLPLLISDRTPWKDLEAQEAGWDLSLEEPDRFLWAIEQLVQADQATYDRWSAGAFRLGKRYLDDAGIVERTFTLLSR